MKSPDKGHDLRKLEGNGGDIWQQGAVWASLSATMESTASELSAIGDSSVNRSKGTDKLADLAASSAGDLKHAAVRYRDTGTALRVYGIALDKAQSWIHPNIEEIERAEHDYQQAVEAKADALSAQHDLDNPFPWQSEPTDAQKTSAGDAVSAARSSLSSAEGHRDELWQKFDQVFETWEGEYETAVGSIQKAMDSADDNDGFWEFVDDALTVVGYVLLLLSVIALIIGAPLTGMLGLIILGLTILTVALTALKFAFGRASLGDVAWSMVGLLPFGISRILSRGAPVLGAVLKGGRGIVTTAIRAGVPKLSLMRPSSWLSPVRSMFAPLTARLALRTPGMFINPLRTIAMGSPEAVQVQRFLSTMKQSAWGNNPAVVQFIEKTAGALPGRFTRALNTVLWGGNLTYGTMGAFAPPGDFLGLGGVQLSGSR